MGAAIVFYLICYGITFTLVHSLVLMPVRDAIGRKSAFFHKMLSCMFCTGFWVVVLVSLLTDYSVAEKYLKVHGTAGAALSGFAGCTVIIAMYLVQCAVENYFKIEW